MTTHTVSSAELPKLSESTITVIKELSAVATFFLCAAVPTLILALRWAV